MTIRVYGDSISMPRCADGISLEQSWPAIVEKNMGANYHVFNRSIGGGTISEICNVFRTDKFYFYGDRGIVIIRLGIVDCAPRPIPIMLRKLLQRMPSMISSPIIAFLHNNRRRILKRKYWVNTGLLKFKKLYSEMVQDACGASAGTCICVGIGPISKDMAENCPGILNEINRYNQVIKNIAEECQKARYVSVDDDVISASDGGILPDGHHNTAEGNLKVANRIARIIMQMEDCGDE